MHHALSGVIENAAYIAIGADSVYDEGRPNWDQGHVEYIYQCTRHAELLETLFHEFNTKFDGCPGVFAYEVAEPFGARYGRALIEGRTPNAEEIARSLCEELFKQGEPDNVTRT